MEREAQGSAHPERRWVERFDSVLGRQGLSVTVSTLIFLAVVAKRNKAAASEAEDCGFESHSRRSPSARMVHMDIQVSTDKPHTLIVTPPFDEPAARQRWQAEFLRAFTGVPAEDPRVIREQDLSDLEQRDVELEEEEDLRTDPREIATQ